MHRFDDKLSWRAVRLLAPAVISAFMVYVAFRVQLENRLTIVEVKSSTIDTRLDRLESKIDLLLERRQRER
jgi:hypothetical protein